MSGPGEDAAAVAAEVIVMYLAEDHERIAVGLNDVVVRRLFAAGLDLQAALGLIGDHRAAGRICHAVDELDQAIQDIRNTIFEHPAPKAIPVAPEQRAICRGRQARHAHRWPGSSAAGCGPLTARLWRSVATSGSGVPGPGGR